MCGLVGYVGSSVDLELVEKIVAESRIRGLHHLGRMETKKAGIVHTRYCTSGGTNQPISLKYGVGLIMNGVIHMGTKKEMEKEYNIKMKTDNDAEVLLQYLDSYSFEDLCELWPHASIAAIILNSKKLLAMRNEKRPLWVLEERGSTILASTQDIFRRAGADWRKAKQLQPNRMYSWTI
jgi:asparagine synthetase B (glutamine-hydrolysing)